MIKTLLEQFAEDPKGLQILQQEGLLIEITQLMCKIMKQKGIKRAELAKKLDKSKGRISQILNAETNLTLRTVADIFTVLGKELCVSSKDLFSEDKPLSFISQTMKDWPKIYSLWGEIPFSSSQVVDNSNQMAG